MNQKQIITTTNLIESLKNTKLQFKDEYTISIAKNIMKIITAISHNRGHLDRLPLDFRAVYFSYDNYSSRLEVSFLQGARINLFNDYNEEDNSFKYFYQSDLEEVFIKDGSLIRGSDIIIEDMSSNFEIKKD